MLMKPLAKNAILRAATVIWLSSCSMNRPLYYWGGTLNGATAYEHLAYQSFDRQTPKSICNLVAVYEDMVTHPGGVRQVPPPGICAEYGYLLLQPGTAETFLNNATPAQKRLFASSDYASLFQDRGKEMLRKEMELYPESAWFIDPIFQKLVK